MEKQSTVEGVTNECNNNNGDKNNSEDCAPDDATACEKGVDQAFVGVAYDYGYFPKILAVHSIKPDKIKRMQETPQTMPPLSPQSRMTGDVPQQVGPPQLGPPQFYPRQDPLQFIQHQYRPPQLSPPHFTQSQHYPFEVNAPTSSPPQFRQQQALHPHYRQMMLAEEAKRMEYWQRTSAMQQMQATLEHERIRRQQQRNMTVANTVPDEVVLPPQMQGVPFSHQRNYDQEGLSNSPLSPDLRRQTSSHQRIWQSHPNDINGYRMPALNLQFQNRQVDNLHSNNLAVKRRFDGFYADSDPCCSSLSSTPKRGRFANAFPSERSTTPVDFPLTQISSPGDRHPQFIPKNNMYQERMTGVEPPYLHQSSVPPLLNFEHVLREQPVREKVLLEYQNRIRLGRRLPQHEYDNYVRLLEKQQQQQQQHVSSEHIRDSIAVNNLSRISENAREWIHGSRPELHPGTIPNRVPQDIANRISVHPKQINTSNTLNSGSLNIRERILHHISDRNPRFIPDWISSNRQNRSSEINADGLQRRMQDRILDRIPENVRDEYPTNEPKGLPMDVFMSDASMERLMHQGNHQLKNAVEHYNRLNQGIFSRQKSFDSCDKCVETVNSDFSTQKEVGKDVANDHESQSLEHCQLEDHSESRTNLANESVISMNSTKTMALESQISTSDFSHLLLIENKRELLRTLKAAAKVSQRILAIVVERLLEKKVLANALILLDHLKLSDLTEIVKERVLSVVREIVWGDPPRLDLWQEKKKDPSYSDETECHGDINVIQITDNEVDDNEAIENGDMGNEAHKNKENDVIENMVNGKEVGEKEVKGNEEMITGGIGCENRNELSGNTKTFQSSNQRLHSIKDDVTKQAEQLSSATKEVAEISDVVSKVTISNLEKRNDSITLNNINYEDCCNLKAEIINESIMETNSQIDDEILMNIKREPNQDKEYNACCYGKETNTVQNDYFENSGYREQGARKSNRCDVNLNTDRVERVVEGQGKTDNVEVPEIRNGRKGVGNAMRVAVKLEPVDDITEDIKSFDNSFFCGNSCDWTTIVVKQEREVNGNVTAVTPIQSDDRVTESQTKSLRKNNVIEEHANEMGRNLNSFGPLRNKVFLPESELETLGNVTICLDASGNIVIKEDEGPSKKDHFEIDYKRKIDKNFNIKKEITNKGYKQDYESSIVGNVFDLFT